MKQTYGGHSYRVKQTTTDQDTAINNLAKHRQKLDDVWSELKGSEYRKIDKVDEAFGHLCNAIDLLDEAVDGIFKEAV